MVNFSRAWRVWPVPESGPAVRVMTWRPGRTVFFATRPMKRRRLTPGLAPVRIAPLTPLTLITTFAASETVNDRCVPVAFDAMAGPRRGAGERDGASVTAGRGEGAAPAPRLAAVGAGLG